MIQIPEQNHVREFRVFLDACGYNTEQLTQRIGRARPPAAGEEQQMFDDSRQITTLNVLVRLFLLGAPVDKSTVDEFLPDVVAEFCHDAGLLQSDGDIINARVVIIPVDDLLFASDAFRILGTEEAQNFVLPASTHSANFLRLLTMQDRVDDTLDLGCGCGIHALFAARHSTRVVATDISPHAIAYTRFNALLNDINNVECIEGSLFEPVTGQQFDLIISNPPFVISPSESFVYRDNAMELDEFCKMLVGEAPRHLKEGAHLQMLCEWVEIENEAWVDRISGWIRGCDAWVLHAAPLSPAAYAQQRTGDLSGESVNAGVASEWTAYFERHKVRAIHPGMLALRRRDGTNWLHVQNLPADVTQPAGNAVLAGIAAVDFLEACDDSALLAATLGLASDLMAEQAPPSDDVVGVRLRLNNGLSAEADIDGAVAAFINLFNNERTVGDCVSEFAKVADAEAAQLTRDLLANVRVFVSRGFLAPLDLE